MIKKKSKRRLRRVEQLYKAEGLHKLVMPKQKVGGEEES